MFGNRNGSIFIGWTEDSSLAECVKQQLVSKGYDAMVGGRNNEVIRHGVGTTVIDQMNACCGAIMLFTKRHFEVTSEDSNKIGYFDSLSSNMLFEFGYLVGTLRVNRVFLVYIDDACKLVPSDMEGMWDYRVVSNGKNNDDLAIDIVNQFLSAQKVSIKDNKMKLCSDISTLKTMINQHMERPVFYDTEMAQIVLIFCQASYMFDDMATAEDLLHELQRACADENHLRIAIDVCMEYYNICNSLESDDLTNTMYLPERKYKKIKYALETYVDEINEYFKDDDEFKSMCLMQTYDFLSFANLMYYTGDNKCESSEEIDDYIKCCNESIINAEKFKAFNSGNNEELASLYLGYMHRNLALFYTQLERSEEAEVEYEASTNARYKLFMFFKQRDLNKNITEQVKMEYYLSLADNILLVDEESRKKKIRDLDNYIRETKELSYNRSLQNMRIESKLEEAKKL